MSARGHAEWKHERVTAKGLPTVVEELLRTAQANPDVLFDITWRTVRDE